MHTHILIYIQFFFPQTGTQSHFYGILCSMLDGTCTAISTHVTSAGRTLKLMHHCLGLNKCPNSARVSTHKHLMDAPYCYGQVELQTGHNCVF
uniref:Secreted protein n=1 Tax=Pyxicephalus adspersus TaxID=30357 RepID=A0AAV3B6S3_PYXAD|nr:TPA: hypothetical protein GDO54_001364 [Pyxicephalus adspersus]